MANNRQSLNQIIMECLKSGDLSSLNDTVEQSARSFISEVEKTLNEIGDISTTGTVKSMSTHFESYTKGSATDERMQKLNNEKLERLKRAQKEAAQKAELLKKNKEEALKLKAQSQVLVPYRRVGDTQAVLISVFSGVGLALSGFGLIKSLFSVFTGSFSVITTLSLIVIMAACFIVLKYGLSQREMLARAKRYAVLCGEKKYISIEELSLAVNRSSKKTLSDIKKMLKKGIFPEGHIDSDKTTLMLTDAVYEEYKRSLNGRKSLLDANPNIQNETELDKLIKEGEEYVVTLSRLNADIPGEVITRKLDRLVTLLNEIFACLKKHPEQIDRMHEVMNYYIPTVVKLVEAYREYDRVSEPGEEIINAKLQIEGSIDTINDALKKILNNLFRDSVWDVTTDASVLNTMLAQKGLVSPFKSKEN